MKATAKAPANIAFIKYWGKKNEHLRIPVNDSISMNLSNAYTVTTVGFSSSYNRDEICYSDRRMNEKETERVIGHLNKIRQLADEKMKAKVVTENSFPKGTGIASSASGFAALTLAATSALELKLSEKELSVLARSGSGSAARSIPDGFVYWQAGNNNKGSYAYSLYPQNYWDLKDIILVTEDAEKEISSTHGHQNAKSSIFFKTRLENLPNKIKKIKVALRDKNFKNFGEIIEEEAIELHMIMITQKPPLFYWNSATLDILHKVLKWRQEGLSVYITLDAGPNVHLICEAKEEENVTRKIRELAFIKNVIINSPAAGARLINKHLF